jgi:hypothetical protein
MDCILQALYLMVKVLSKTEVWCAHSLALGEAELKTDWKENKLMNAVRENFRFVGSRVTGGVPLVGQTACLSSTAAGQDSYHRFMSHTTWQHYGHVDDDPSSPFYVLKIDSLDRNVGEGHV